jgi:cysteinyl-tRNA synthetase
MNDDFNTAQAIAALFEHLKKLKKDIQGYHYPSDFDALQKWLQQAFENILGLPLSSEASIQQDSSELTKELIDILLDLRSKARLQKDFQLSDTIRDRLHELGVVLEDSHQGTRYTLPK